MKNLSIPIGKVNEINEEITKNTRNKDHFPLQEDNL